METVEAHGVKVRMLLSTFETPVSLTSRIFWCSLPYLLSLEVHESFFLPVSADGLRVPNRGEAGGGELMNCTLTPLCFFFWCSNAVGS